MKAKFLYVLTLILSMCLMACSQDEANVSVVIGSSPYPLIPATAISCVAIANAGSGSSPTSDISANYFRVPTITFTRKNTSQILVIALIRIKITIPGGSTPVSCDVGGDGLAALSSTWWTNTGKEASVAVGVDTFSTSCPLYCGGINVGNTSFTAAGTMEVYGLERNPTTSEEVPVKIQTTISIQNF